MWSSAFSLLRRPLRCVSVACLLGVSASAFAGYSTCGSTIVSSSTRTCSDGSLAVYHSGEALLASATSVDFGNVEVGKTRTQTITLKNNTAYNLGFSGNVTISNEFLKDSSTDCGQSLANASSCTITVKFTPGSTGLVNGQVQVSVAFASTPYTIALKGTGIVTGSSTTPSTPTAPTPTHATKTTPTSCISYISGTTFEVPYFSFNGSPMWARLSNSGSITSYKLMDYGPLTTTGSSTCVADGGKLELGSNGAATLQLAHLLYGNGFYTATLQLVDVDKDGLFLFNIVAAETYRSPSSGSSSSIDHSILVGNWALHNGMSTVTFKDDGTYSSANGGTGTYRWEGNHLFVTGALTSGRDMEVTLEVAASATWLHVDFDISGYTVRSTYYKMK